MALLSMGGVGLGTPCVSTTAEEAAATPGIFATKETPKEQIT